MEFDRYLSGLPEYEFAITYGSGVFPQKGYSAKDVHNAMLDVIVGVENLKSGTGPIWGRIPNTIRGSVI